MGRRIEVELTSSREDGLWTWRAAGARQPRGELVGSLLYAGAKVGDVVKVEAEFHVDGIEVTEVFAPREKRERTDLLELKPRQLRDDELVTTQRVRRDDRSRRRDGDRPRHSDGDRRGDGGGRSDGERRGGRRRERPAPPPEIEQRPKAKRLRPRREHRNAILADVPEEHRPIIEQLVRDGMPGVRAAIDRQNAEAKESGKPEIDAAPVLAIAERYLPKARLAEWRDRADAALATVADLDLRDLRSVVVAGNDLARDEESREQADKLKAALDERVEADHAAWLDDLEIAVTTGRVVRALRLSSRPVKAGAPLPAELASTLAGQASAALAPDTPQERWATVIDALAFSPVRGAVTPVGIPAEPNEELLTAVRRLADRIPTIAGLFGIDPAEAAKAARRRGRDGRRRPGSGGAGGGGDRPPKADARNSATEDSATAPAAMPTDAGSTEAPEAEAPTPEAIAAEAIAAEAIAAEASDESAETPGDAPAGEHTAGDEGETTDAAEPAEAAVTVEPEAAAEAAEPEAAEPATLHNGDDADAEATDAAHQTQAG